MSVKSILVLSVLMIAGSQNQVQAETMRDTEIPHLDITRMAGDWYLLAVSKDMNELSCVKSTIAKKTDDSYTMTTTVTRSAEAMKTNPTSENTRQFDPTTCTRHMNTEMMKCIDEDGDSMGLVHFDIDYDSYIIGYTTPKMEELGTGTEGTISILGRHKTMPDGLMDKVKQSNFYKHGLGTDPKMVTAKTDGC